MQGYRTFRRRAICAMLGIVAGTQAAYADQPHLASAAFIQLNTSLAQQSAQWWYDEVDYMDDIGIDTIIIQYAAFDGTSFYDTVDNTNDSYYTLSSSNNDPIEHILHRADQIDLEVYVGLGLETQFNVTYNGGTGQFEFNYNKSDVIDRAKSMLTDIDETYGYEPGVGPIHESLVGWYFPTELNDSNVIRSGHATFLNDAVDYYSELSSYAHTETGLNTMISPYIASDGAFYSPEVRDPAAYAAWWDGILDDDPYDPDDPFVDIDIIAHQDSVGADHVSILGSREYFEELKPVLDNNDVELWANVEAFHSIGAEAAPFSNFTNQSSTKTAFRDQLNSTAAYAEKTALFEFTTYMSPRDVGNTTLDNSSDALYEDYGDYRNAELDRIQVDSYEYDNPTGTSFHGTANDPNEIILTDYVTGLTDGGAGNAFANGTFVGYSNTSNDSQPLVTFDLGSQFSLDRVEIWYLVDALSSIFAPQEITGVADAITILGSNDGTNFTEIATLNDFISWSTDDTNDAFELRRAVIDLGGADYRYVQLDARTFNTWLFLSEVAFYEGDGASDPTPVPEPASWAAFAMLAGLLARSGRQRDRR
ncbi:MAG: DUF4434 domain-containing protein [Phycisphaerales bacterium]